MTDVPRMDRRRQFFFGMMLSTVLAGFFAIFMCLWRVVPSWAIGGWSLRAQYAFTPASSLDGLLRDYHRALDRGYSHALDLFLIDRLRDPVTIPEERNAILRFFSLRVPHSRAAPELFTLGMEWIGPVLEATDDADVEVRYGAVFFMEGLYLERRLYKPVIHADQDGPSVGLSRDERLMRAYIAFHEWWSLPAEQRDKRSPLGEAGLTINEP